MVKNILAIVKRIEEKNQTYLGSFILWTYVCWGRVGGYETGFGLFKTMIFEMWNDSTQLRDITL